MQADGIPRILGRHYKKLKKKQNKTQNFLLYMEKEGK